MNNSEGSRARRVEVTQTILQTGFGRDVDYAAAFEVTASDLSSRSAEQWARTMFEAAPAAVRWFLALGWRVVLGLKLARGRSPEHVLGWKIITVSHDTARLEARSWLLTARKSVQVAGSRVTVTTFVHYERPLARAIWSAVAPIHHLTEPYLLGRASRLSSPPNRAGRDRS